MQMRGVLEGFYGRPWTWEERTLVSRFCAERSMTHYVYAPKDDPKQRHEWREPYTDEELDRFQQLAVEGGVTISCAISPGLSIDYRSGEDRALLMAKIESLVESGAGRISLQLDDIPNRDGLGKEHGELTAWVHQHLAGRAELDVIPTEYVGHRRTDYLAALADLVPEEVPIGWTGELVVNETISVADATARAGALGGRRPLLWDNYPVNDGPMADQLFVGPLRGREQGLVEACDGYMANGLVQPRAGLLPLASIAAYLRGDDPVSAWQREADALGVRTFAEACDGEVPRTLAIALADEGGSLGWPDAAGPLGTWLRAARACQAPGLEDEVAPWLEAVHQEAEVALRALRAYQETKPLVRIDGEGRGRAVAPSEEGASRNAMRALVGWKSVRRGEHVVLGPRVGIKVAYGQGATIEMALRSSALEEDRNATDIVVRAAVAELDAFDAPEPLRVIVGAEDVPVAEDGTFTAPPGATVVVRSGRAATRVTVPCEPPLPERRLD